MEQKQLIMEVNKILEKIRKKGPVKKYPSILNEKIFHLSKNYSLNELSSVIDIPKSSLNQILVRMRKKRPSPNEKIDKNKQDFNFLDITNNFSKKDENEKKIFIKLITPLGITIELYQ